MRIKTQKQQEFLAAGDASIKKAMHKTVPENLCPGQFEHSRTCSSVSVEFMQRKGNQIRCDKAAEVIHA